MSISIVMPCFNEGKSLLQLLSQLEEVLLEVKQSVEIVVVNDGSTDDTLNQLKTFRFSNDKLSLTVLHLKVNIGHQRAIRQGLLYAQTTEAEHIIVMDADGEDNPEIIPQMLQMTQYEVVHVIRGKRQEKFGFRLAYFLYRLLYLVITGKRMNFGNYCMLNQDALTRILGHSYVHFAAFLQNQPLKRGFITSDRKKRLDGKSKMNMEKWVYHGFMSLVENAQNLLMLFFKFFVGLMVVLVFLGGYILYHKLFTGKAILGWASTLSVGIANLALLSFGVFVLGLLLMNILKRQTHTPETAMYEVVGQD
jgi:glycosyltransferase involved in cell wall biosynthesis